MSSTIPAYSSKPLKSEIVFGSPGMGCQGAGICMIVPVAESPPQWKCPHASAWISVLADGKIRLSFEKSGMPDLFMKRYFRWLLFQVFEPYTIPRSIQKRLRTGWPLTIHPGIYPVQETSGHLTVDF